jgi:hypothetical protein
VSTATDAVQARAEILKLARLLQRDPVEFAYLEAVPLDDLQALREQTTEVMWQANGAALGRLAAASRLLPAGLTATISERAFGPLLSARMAGLLEPERAVEVATRLPIPFLADIAILLDPRRASALIALVPAEQTADVTRELVQRGEYVTMGRFVGHLGDQAITAALAVMDDATLLRVGFVLEDKDRLEWLVGLLSDERLGRIVGAAAEHGLWLEALDLLGHLSPAQRLAIVTGAPDLDRAAIEAILATVAEYELWQEVLEIAEQDEALQDRLAERVGVLPPAERQDIARRAEIEGALERLGRLGQVLAAS